MKVISGDSNGHIKITDTESKSVVWVGERVRPDERLGIQSSCPDSELPSHIWIVRRNGYLELVDVSSKGRHKVVVRIAKNPITVYCVGNVIITVHKEGLILTYSRKALLKTAIKAKKNIIKKAAGASASGKYNTALMNTLGLSPEAVEEMIQSYDFTTDDYRLSIPDFTNSYDKFASVLEEFEDFNVPDSDDEKDNESDDDLMLVESDDEMSVMSMSDDDEDFGVDGPKGPKGSVARKSSETTTKRPDYITNIYLLKHAHLEASTCFNADVFESLDYTRQQREGAINVSNKDGVHCLATMRSMAGFHLADPRIPVGVPEGMEEAYEKATKGYWERFYEANPHLSTDYESSSEDSDIDSNDSIDSIDEKYRAMLGPRWKQPKDVVQIEMPDSVPIPPDHPIHPVNSVFLMVGGRNYVSSRTYKIELSTGSLTLVGKTVSGVENLGITLKRAVKCVGYLGCVNGVHMVYTVDHIGLMKVYMTTLRADTVDWDSLHHPLIYYQATNNRCAPSVIAHTTMFEDIELDMDFENEEIEKSTEDVKQKIQKRIERMDAEDKRKEEETAEFMRKVKEDDAVYFSDDDDEDPWAFRNYPNPIQEAMEERLYSAIDNIRWYIVVCDIKGHSNLLSIRLDPMRDRVDTMMRDFKDFIWLREFDQKNKLKRMARAWNNHKINTLVNTAPGKRGDKYLDFMLQSIWDSRPCGAFKMIEGTVLGVQFAPDQSIVMGGIDRKVYVYRRKYWVWQFQHKINLKAKIRSVLATE